MVGTGGSEDKTAIDLDRTGACPRSPWRTLRGLVEETVSQWSADCAPRLGAALAFYALLSLAPLLIVIVGMAAVVFGQEAANGQLAWQIRSVVGWETARAIQTAIKVSAYRPGTGVIAMVLSLVTVMFGASSVVVELRDSLNTIWHVRVSRQETGLKSLLRMGKERFYSFALILGVGLLLLISLAWSALVAAMGRFFHPVLPAPEPVLHAASFLTSFVALTFLFAAIYKTVPDVQLEWSDVAVGAAVTSLIYTLGKVFIGMYLGKAGFSSTYGAAASLVVLLVWVYYSALLFFLGAEFTKVYAQSIGSHSARGADAVRNGKRVPLRRSPAG